MPGAGPGLDHHSDRHQSAGKRVTTQAAQNRLATPKRQMEDRRQLDAALLLGGSVEATADAGGTTGRGRGRALSALRQPAGGRGGFSYRSGALRASEGSLPSWVQAQAAVTLRHGTVMSRGTRHPR